MVKRKRKKEGTERKEEKWDEGWLENLLPGTFTKEKGCSVLCEGFGLGPFKIKKGNLYVYNKKKKKKFN